MESTNSSGSQAKVALHAVTADNWRDVAGLTVTEAQRSFVAEPSYYLALCCYDDSWHPLAIALDDQIIGFLMWAIDPEDESGWLGGILIDEQFQRRGYGRQAVQAAIALLTEQEGCKRFALSYEPGNGVAKELYATIGFVEIGQWEESEIVARLTLPAA